MHPTQRYSANLDTAPSESWEKVAAMSQYRLPAKSPNTVLLVGTDRHMGLFLTIFGKDGSIENPFQMRRTTDVKALETHLNTYADLEPKRINILVQRLAEKLKNPGSHMNEHEDWVEKDDNVDLTFALTANDISDETARVAVRKYVSMMGDSSSTVVCMRAAIIDALKHREWELRKTKQQPEPTSLRELLNDKDTMLSIPRHLVIGLQIYLAACVDELDAAGEHDDSEGLLEALTVASGIDIATIE